MEEKAEFTHFCDDPKYKTLVIYKTKDKSPWRIEIPYETDYAFAVTQIKNQLFFTGGGKASSDVHSEVFYKTVMRLTLKIADMDTIIDKLPGMAIARTNHSMATINEKYLFVVGGFNFSSIISSCEEFDIEKSVWTPCPSLNEKRMWISLIAVEPKTVYAFGGAKSNDSNGAKIIESLDINNKTSKTWQLITLSSGADIWPEIHFAGTFQISPEVIMIFGGIVGKVEVSDTYMFNITTKAITRGKNLTHKDVFYMTKPIFSENDAIAIGKNEGHVYNFLDQKWSVIKGSLAPESGFFIKADTY